MARTLKPLEGVRQRSHVNTGFIERLRSKLSVHIDISGLDEAIARIERFNNDGAKKRVSQAMSQTVDVVRNRAVKKAPYRTGDLRNSIFGNVRTWGPGDMSGAVGSDGRRLKDALIPFVLEGGRKANKGQARKSTTEYFYNNGKKRRKLLGYQDVGAIKPRRWLWKSYTWAKKKIDAIWTKTLELITQDLAGKQ